MRKRRGRLDIPAKSLRAPFSPLIQKSARAKKYFLNSTHFGMPCSVQIEVTTKCNIKCALCMRTYDRAKITDSDMPLDFFKSVIDQLKSSTESVNLVGLGEPLLHPDIFSMIRYAKDSGLEVSVIDNFTLINREKSLDLINSGLDFLYVSFDSTSKVAFEKIRTGACFETVVENIKLFAETKKEVKSKIPVFLFKSTISYENFEEIPKLVRLAEELGVDGVNFGKMIDPEDPFEKNFALVLEEKDKPQSKIAVYPCELSKTYQCDALSGCYIAFDGKVLPCGLMAEGVSRAMYPQLQLGDLRFETMANVWRSDNFRKLRKNLESGKYLTHCKGCPGYIVPKAKS